MKIPIIIIACLVLLVSITTGYIGLTNMSRTEYEYYPGLSTDIGNYGQAVSNLMDLLMSWTQPFNNTYNTYKPELYEKYVVNLTRHQEVGGVITETTANIIFYGKLNSTENTFNSGNVMYKIYGIHDTEGSMLEYLTNNGYKFIFIRSFINGDKLLANGRGANRDLQLTFEYTEDNVIWPKESINTTTTYYIYNSVEKYIEGTINNIKLVT
jgi:hypothetical protein